MTIAATIAEIEAAMEQYGHNRVRLGPDGELVIVEEPPLPAPAHMPGSTHTFVTTDIVVDTVRGWVWAEDFSEETFTGVRDVPFHSRVGAYIDADHVRAFQSMAFFTGWLQQEGCVVGKAYYLGAELSDEERKA